LDLAGLRVPEAQGGVVPAACDECPVGRERDGAEAAPAGGEAAEFLAGGDLPQPGEVRPLLVVVVVAGPHQVVAVGGEGGREQGVVVLEGPHDGPFLQVHQVDALAGGGRDGDLFAVGGVGHPAGEGARVRPGQVDLVACSAGGGVKQVEDVAPLGGEGLA